MLEIFIPPPPLLPNTRIHLGPTSKKKFSRWCKYCSTVYCLFMNGSFFPLSKSLCRFSWLWLTTMYHGIKKAHKADYDDVILCKELKTQPRHYCYSKPERLSRNIVAGGSYIPWKEFSLFSKKNGQSVWISLKWVLKIITQNVYVEWWWWCWVSMSVMPCH